MRIILSMFAVFVAIFVTTATAQNDNKAKFSIGAIADCQFANQDNYGERLYRRSPKKLEDTVRHLNSFNLDHVVHLGDFIDTDWNSFDLLKPITNQLKHPLYHVLGNHDFSVADNKKHLVTAKLNMPARYHSFKHKNWRFIITDGNDISTHAWPVDSAEYKAAKSLHADHYPDRETWNGAFSKKQINWLTSELVDAEKLDEKVVIYSHFPIYPANEHNVWNDQELLSLLKSHKSVKLWLNGHNHDGNYAKINDIHFLTLKAMVNTEETAYTRLDFDENHIKVIGFGRQESMILPFK